MRFSVFNCFIDSFSSQSLIGESNISSVIVGFALPFICLRVSYSRLTIFDFRLAYSSFFCARKNVHANVLAFPLSLVITSLFSCIGTLLLQEGLF